MTASLRTDRLLRSSDDRWVAGVCGGLARRFDVDPTLVRLTVVVLTLLGLGSVVVAYLVAWVLMPLDERLTPFAGPGPTNSR